MVYVTSGLITYVHHDDGSIHTINKTVTPQPEGDTVPTGRVIYNVPPKRVSESTKRRRYNRNVRMAKVPNGKGLLGA